ncbi:gluconate 2-dehydrogenase subunit 3 family protein [Sphingobacterium sp. InxBP1]|uniref:gluconate 2-dehydrogenase subunit 3 family protein n=1 Tax=Sphingobacterium sp. InxBP1 TaxID=2870328 RepID=UPI0022442812|nr:gluconate 2-dehydrogenase subunit 3 family protein [Sphingobacterium sp. InxBP1]MCW8312841.1 gluconate 2-dehydrogenase subunit 3 family protein [Sphingobacterium sp. InxBP1]
MERRTLLKMITLLTGGAVIGGHAFLTGCSGGRVRKLKEQLTFTPEQLAFLDEVADTILPTTQKSPGAKAAKVGAFMTVIVRDCYEVADQEVFLEGIDKLDTACKKMHNFPFVKATPEQRLALLTSIDQEAKEYMSQKQELPNHYYTMFKQLTLLGYFSSEIGAKQALRYNQAPGRYEGDVPYKKGDRAWA